MASANSFLNNRPAWVDLASPDPHASSDFYSKLLGWDIQVDPDPQYGGYAMAVDAGVGVAGIGSKMDPAQATVWSLYIGTDDADALAQSVTDNGGKVLVPPFQVNDQGRLGVFADPIGAVISCWEAAVMRGFVSHQLGAFDWGELNGRNLQLAMPFYEKVFGWTVRSGEVPGNTPPYSDFTLEGETILGAYEMGPDVPVEVPNHWRVYFKVADVDLAYAVALDLGATPVMAPQNKPELRFAVVADPQGATFGMLRFRSSDL